ADAVHGANAAEGDGDVLRHEETWCVRMRKRGGPRRVNFFPRGCGRAHEVRLTGKSTASSSRALCPGSIVPRTLESADGWIPGTSPGMTTEPSAGRVNARAPS